MRSPKCLSQSEAKTAIVVDGSVREAHTRYSTCFPVNFCQKLFRCCREKAKIPLPISGKGKSSLKTDWPENKLLEEDVEYVLRPGFVKIPFCICRGKLKNDSADERRPGWQSMSARKNIDQLSFVGCRGDAKNV